MSLGDFIGSLTTILMLAILGRSLLSWFPQIPSNNPLVRILYTVTEPILAPIRRVVPRFGALDFTPMIAILILYVIGAALAGV